MALKLMLVGTASDVGKSFLVTALCRACSNRGLKVKPFKSQNMANNSYISYEGHELGRAQAEQAFAARALPSSRMNPILLKPSSDTGSELIVRGKSLGLHSAQTYQKMKKDLLGVVLESFSELEKDADIVIVEGAGSAAEINLREDDIVNMGLAEAIDAPVILVADIDRGGVFASLYGTYMLLAQEERKRVIGYVINKFRGDKNLLEPGLRMLEDLIGIPCLGVLPYQDIFLDAEDSLSFSSRSKYQGKLTQNIASYNEDIFDLAILHLEHIANVSDFDNFERYQNIAIRYVKNPEDISGKNAPNMVLIPGTKASVYDMDVLQKSRMAQALENYAHKGGHIFGICGGFQMLGTRLLDPCGVEGVVKEAEGLKIFDFETEFISPRTMCRTDARYITNMPKALASLNSIEISGYEIHYGVSRPITKESQAQSFINPFQTYSTSPKREDSLLAAMSKDGKIFASYLHGIFDNDKVIEACFSYAKPGFVPQTYDDAQESLEAFKEDNYEKLAHLIEEYIDVESLLDKVKSYSKEA
ncbi:MAG: cobyric acid synthase [Coriobacteriia bacterium]|nr:cobyric acid synthase [Coriobacteriia bacterium]